jgi:hypothetical protein
MDILCPGSAAPHLRENKMDYWCAYDKEGKIEARLGLLH